MIYRRRRQLSNVECHRGATHVNTTKIGILSSASTRFHVLLSNLKIRFSQQNESRRR